MAGIFTTEAEIYSDGKGNYAGLTRQITIDNEAPTYAIIQNIQASVGVQIQTFYEIGSKYAYRVAGRPQGQGQLSNLIGPTDKSYDMMKSLCTVCGKSHELKIATVNACKGSDVSAASGKTITFTGCLATNISVTADAAQDIINGNLTLIFLNADVN